MKYPYLIIILAVFLFLGCPLEEKYHVYYYGNGFTNGSPPVDSNEYYYGDSAIILGKGNLEKKDCEFLGWLYYDTLYFEGERIFIGYGDVYLYAAWDDGSDTPFSFKVENGEVTITRYNESRSSFITIPDNLQNKPVTAIDESVFSNLSISGINLPKNLKNIGIGSFASNNITQLIIPDKVIYIGLGAFRNNKLKKITFGASLTSIEPHTFSKNQLTDIIIPENIVTVGAGAFDENKIDMIKIGAGVDIKNDNSFGAYGMSFREFYNLEKKAGIYIYTGNEVWERY